MKRTYATGIPKEKVPLALKKERKTFGLNEKKRYLCTAFANNVLFESKRKEVWVSG